jgi:superfamily II DNA helicase RecQ
MIKRLVDADFLRPRELSHGGVVLELTPAGHAALQDPERLQPLVAEALPPLSPPEKSAERDGEVRPMDASLFERLRAWRKETAEVADVPAYVVAHDSLLREIATIRPQTEKQLLQVKGIGPKKLEKYGAAILAVVRGVDP